MKNQLMRVEEVAQELEVSRSYAYRLIRQLNAELREKGYMTIAGRVNRQYFKERLYGTSDRLDYIMNPEKTDGGILISSHACSPETAADEFMLYRQEYLNTTGRKRKDEVLAYHVRQAFRPGEITPEKANEIGKALAERLTDELQ